MLPDQYLSKTRMPINRQFLIDCMSTIREMARCVRSHRRLIKSQPSRRQLSPSVDKAGQQLYEDKNNWLAMIGKQELADIYMMREGVIEKQIKQTNEKVKSLRGQVRHLQQLTIQSNERLNRLHLEQIQMIQKIKKIQEKGEESSKSQYLMLYKSRSQSLDRSIKSEQHNYNTYYQYEFSYIETQMNSLITYAKQLGKVKEELGKKRREILAQIHSEK